MTEVLARKIIEWDDEKEIWKGELRLCICVENTPDEYIPQTLQDKYTEMLGEPLYHNWGFPTVINGKQYRYHKAEETANTKGELVTKFAKIEKELITTLRRVKAENTEKDVLDDYYHI